MSIKFENTVTPSPEQWEAIIIGARNPMNSWSRYDSEKLYGDPYCAAEGFKIGSNDLDLLKRLCKAGTDHRKFMRMITVYTTITAPLYFLKEFDTYAVGVVKNSCSTMHKIAEKEFTIEDFSHEHLLSLNDSGAGFDYNCVVRNEANKNELVNGECVASSIECLKLTIDVLNVMRYRYLKTNNKDFWWQMIQLLPSSYNQKRTVMLNYEVLANIYKSRKGHKLDEWCEHDNSQEYFGFCDWIKTLPYSELITEIE